jgi:hypothetical protein
MAEKLKKVRIGKKKNIPFINQSEDSKISRSLRIKLKHFSNRPSSVVLEYINFNLLLF